MLTRLMAASAALALTAGLATAQTTMPADPAVPAGAPAPVGAPVVAPAAPMAVDTATFATMAPMGSLYEVQAANVALERGKLESIKSFAAEMRTAHMKMTEDMKPLVEAAGLTIPLDLDSDHKQKVNALNAATEEGFDTMYIAQQIEAHSMALALYQGYAANGTDPALQAYAAAAVPVIQAHLDQAVMIQSGMESPNPPAN